MNGGNHALEEIRSMSARDADKEQAYGSLFHEYVCLVQKFSDRLNPVHLCFGPIGTNMVMLTNELLINVKLGRRTTIVPGTYSFDEKYIQTFNREHGTRHTVLPWVLQRFDGNYSHPNPWTIWFEDLNENEADCPDPVARRLELESEIARLRPELKAPHVLETGICAAYAGRLNGDSLAMVRQHEQAPEEGCVAVHIRRGDACNESLDYADPKRQHFPLQRYIEEMESYIAEGYRSFYIMTESQREIERLAEHFESACRLYYNETDRSRFPSLQGKQSAPEHFIEYHCLDDPELVKFSMETALVDFHN